jgi:hypothetical protein
LNCDVHEKHMDGGARIVLALGLVLWLACALPVAMLIGYCALGEEL